MQQLEMLRKRFEQSGQILDDIVAKSKQDIAEQIRVDGTRKKMEPEEYKFQLQAILARTLPVNDLLALSAEMLYRLSGDEIRSLFERDIPMPDPPESEENLSADLDDDAARR